MIRRAAILALVAGLVGGVSWELAAQRLHNSVMINACYKIRNGKLRIAGVMPDGTLFCRRGELAIQWPATCECQP